MAVPGVYDLNIYQGDTFRISFRILDSNNDPLDLTGQTPKSEIRDAPGGTLIESFTATLATQSGDTLGQVDLEMASADTTALTPGTIGVWDLQLTNAGEVTTYIGGSVTVQAEVTE